MEVSHISREQTDKQPAMPRLTNRREAQRAGRGAAALASYGLRLGALDGGRRLWPSFGRGGRQWRSRGRIIIPAFVPAFTAKGSGGLLPEMISPWVMSLDAGEFRLMTSSSRSVC